MVAFAIISLILSALASVGSGIAYYRSQKKTNEQNLDQYNDWKNYNTPAEQMQRLNDAGLNPYLVSNVGNTLSSPFQFGQNTGVAESLSGLSNSLAQGAQFAQSSYQAEENRKIQRESNEIKKQQLELNSLGLEIRKKLASMSLRVGDAREALLWSQGRAQDLSNLWQRSSMPYRLSGLYLANAAREQDIEHNANMYPLIEKLYEPAQRAKINSLYRNMSHYDFMESFMADKFRDEMALRWANHYFNKEYSWQKFQQAENWFNQRYALSRDYWNLANKKFRWSNFWRGYDTFRGERDSMFKLLKFGLGKSPNQYGIPSYNLKF